LLQTRCQAQLYQGTQGNLRQHQEEPSCGQETNYQGVVLPSLRPCSDTRCHPTLPGYVVLEIDEEFILRTFNAAFYCYNFLNYSLSVFQSRHDQLIPSTNCHHAYLYHFNVDIFLRTNSNRYIQYRIYEIRNKKKRRTKLRGFATKIKN
jgi:hypothetical protein